MASPLRTAVPAALAVAALVLGGCGSKEQAGGSGDAPTSAPKSSTTKKPSKDAGASISQGAQGRRTTGQATLSVVRVARGGRLDVRASPSDSSKLLARLRPLAHGLVATGEQKGAWVRVRANGATGWVRANHVAYLGGAASHAQRVAGFDIGATRREVAAKAARALGLGTDIVFVRVHHPIVVLDVLGEGDDSVSGARLRLVLEYGEAGFQVKQADSRPICPRGLSAEGLCQ